MQDSLRDQLLQAGFEEKKSYPRKKRTPPKSKKQGKKIAKPFKPKADNKKVVQQNTTAEIERKRIKAKIKELIEEAMVKEHKGDLVYSYILGSRVKQIYVNKDCHERIINQELAITRLNGSTHLIPLDTADKVKALNPDWAIVLASNESTDQAVDTEYTDYQIPDDLHW